MINKKIDEISTKLDTIKILVQDNEYLENIEKRCDEVNKKYTQVLEIALERYERIQKAIDYIEIYIDFEDSSKLDTKKELKEILDILKGGNNE